MKEDVPGNHIALFSSTSLCSKPFELPLGKFVAPMHLKEMIIHYRRTANIQRAFV